MAIVGREPGVDILLLFPQVSARHAHLQRLGPKRYKVRDLGSANGTFVNGTRVEESVVTPSDELRFGSLVFDWSKHLNTLEREGGDSGGITIGRDTTNQIVLADQRVSGSHARVTIQGDRLVLTDCGSVNGTFVNGQKITQATIGRGDRIQFGSFAVDLFALLHARGFLAGGGSAPSPVIVDAGPRPPQPPVDPTPPGPLGPPGRDLSTGAIVAISLAAVVAIAVAAVFLTRVTITKNCAACSREIFRKEAFFWERNAVQAEANQLRFCDQCQAPITVTKNCEVCGQEIFRKDGQEWQRAQFEAEARGLKWCTKCASELIPVTFHVKCITCGRTYQEYQEMMPRRDVTKQDVEKVEGYCSDACRTQDMAQKLGQGVKDLAEKGLSNLLDKVPKP